MKIGKTKIQLFKDGVPFDMELRTLQGELLTAVEEPSTPPLFIVYRSGMQYGNVVYYSGRWKFEKVHPERQDPDDVIACMLEVKNMIRTLER